MNILNSLDMPASNPFAEFVISIFRFYLSNWLLMIIWHVAIVFLIYRLLKAMRQAKKDGILRITLKIILALLFVIIAPLCLLIVYIVFSFLLNLGSNLLWVIDLVIVCIYAYIIFEYLYNKNHVKPNIIVNFKTIFITTTVLIILFASLAVTAYSKEETSRIKSQEWEHCSQIGNCVLE